MERLFSVEEAAKALGGVSPLTIRGWISQGKIQRIKVGRRTMVRESDLKSFIEDGNSALPKAKQAMDVA